MAYFMALFWHLPGGNEEKIFCIRQAYVYCQYLESSTTDISSQ
jgi:hypothetical protein